MMIVTQQMDNTISLWIKKELIDGVSNIFKETYLELYECRNAIDTFMTPHFILILDGRLITKDDKDIDTWECYLSGWSGKLSRCNRCQNRQECISDEVDDDTKDSPEYNPPIILLHQDKMQRQVEGIISLLPPVPVTNPLSDELTLWIQSEIFVWYRKVQRWRKEFDQWIITEELREKYRPKKASDIAKARWLPRKITTELPTSKF